MVVLEVKLGRKGGRKEFLRLERRVLSNGETSLRATLLPSSEVVAFPSFQPQGAEGTCCSGSISPRVNTGFDETKPRVFDLLLDPIDSTMTTMTTPTKAKARFTHPPPSLSLSTWTNRNFSHSPPLESVRARLVSSRLVYTRQSLQIAKRVQLTNFPRVTTRQPCLPTSLTILRPITSRSPPTSTPDFVADTPTIVEGNRKKEGREKRTIFFIFQQQLNTALELLLNFLRKIIETVRVIRR